MLSNLSSLRPWDAKTDLFQYETNFKILTRSNNKNESYDISLNQLEETKNNCKLLFFLLISY